jgi:hypothetical protein
MPDCTAFIETDATDARMVMAAPPGTELPPGTPALFIAPEASDLAIEGLVRAHAVQPPLQVYRVRDEQGCASVVVAPLFGEVHAGQPMLRVLRNTIDNAV